MVRVILLGPQRRPTVGAVVRSLGLGRGGLDGTVAMITAGWQEREADDGELTALLGGRAANLGLYRRWLDVQDRDPAYAAGERRLQEVLTERQEVYLLRLDHALQAVYALQRRGQRLGAGTGARAGAGAGAGAGGAGAGAVGAGAEALAEAIEAVRELDAAHLRHLNNVRGEFFEELRPHDRPVIRGHRSAVAAALADSAALVIAGGHVGVLADVLHLFNVAADLRSPVIAWSAGAMTLADRIVLFHDRSARGPGHPEIYGSGLSVLRDVVLLPHARARLLLDDTPRMAVFARRFAPARCILLESGTRLDAGRDLGGRDLGGRDFGGRAWPAGTRVLAEDGHIISLEAA